MFSVEVINELRFMNDCMEVLTFFLIGVSFKYRICSVYHSTGVDPIKSNEDLFFNLVVWRFSDKLRYNYR